MFKLSLIVTSFVFSVVAFAKDTVRKPSALARPYTCVTNISAQMAEEQLDTCKGTRGFSAKMVGLAGTNAYVACCDVGGGGGSPGSGGGNGGNDMGGGAGPGR